MCVEEGEDRFVDHWQGLGEALCGISLHNGQPINPASRSRDMTFAGCGTSACEKGLSLISEV
jgi:hypothetical protein